jgi:UDP-N-acetylmuramoylalanine--D-glutamate ligase
MLDLANKSILVLGLGDTGLAAARWLAARGANVRVADSRDAPPHAAKLHRDLPQVPLANGPFRASSFAGANIIVTSPGVPLSEPLVRRAQADGIPVVGDVELFGQALARLDNPPRVVGITGSNGKSTVTKMAGDLCAGAGLKTVVAGNIGLPVLDALAQAELEGQPDVYVLELSSFQLETTANLRLASATVLNVTQDHMDRYSDLHEYAEAKARIFMHCATQVLNQDDQISLQMRRPGNAAKYFTLQAPLDEDHFGVVEERGERWLAEGSHRLMRLAELPVAGLHNAANALAALALTRALGLDAAPLTSALRRFRGLPHRVEKVMEIEGVTFYDDSKGTNVGATVAALNGMTQRVVLIAGGDGKGQDFTPLCDPVAKHARAVVLIGRDAPRIAAAVEPSGVPQVLAKDMNHAVRLSLQAGRAGDVVLLSPACASFDMFDNYVHRARVFADAVRALAVERRLAKGEAA